MSLNRCIKDLRRVHTNKIIFIVINIKTFYILIKKKKMFDPSLNHKTLFFVYVYKPTKNLEINE